MSRIARFVASFGLAALSLLSLYAAGCGGGGGGGSSDSDNPADVALSVRPKELDTGDFTSIEIDVSNVNPSGILLKVAFPDALAYVRGSSTLDPDDAEPARFEPSIVEEASDVIYLVYFIGPTSLGESGRGVLQFRLKAIAQLADGFVSIDADQNDPQISDSREFDADAPNFTAVDQEDIEVTDGSSTPTAAPSGTVTATTGG